MYKELTKTIIENGKEMVVCASYKTPECQAGNGVNGCTSCPKLGAMINQLHVFETVIKTAIKE